MIAATLAMLLAGQVVVPSADGPDDVEEEVVVIGRRLEAWRGAVTYQGKRPRCRTLASSGDRAIDRVGCAAMVHCMTALRAEAPVARDVAGMTRGMSECVPVQRSPRIRALIAARRR